MKHSVQKDKLRRRKYADNEKSHYFYKILIHDQSLSKKHRSIIMYKWQLLDQLSFRGKIKRYCLITQRSASCLKFFSLSRIEFRKLANAGYLPGIKRSSW